MQGSIGSGTYLSGLKEVYFGRMLRGTNVTAEFIEAIGSWKGSIFNLYLVSRYEGMSLKQLLYEGSAEFRGSPLYQASARMPSISDFGGGAEPAASLLPSLIVSRLATPK
ncbi:hypothetical protein FCV25MIE_32039 [Fagus crenata]